MNRKLFSVLAAIFLLGYLWISRGQWFIDLERQADIGDHPVFSEVLDLTHVGVTTWRIPKEKWSYREGEAKLALVFDNAPKLSESVRDRSKLPLRLTVSAQGIDQHGVSTDRLIRNWYFTTNEPFDPQTKIWSSGGPTTFEHGLAGLAIYPFEETMVSINITVPDASLSVGNPRLKLVGEHDSAVYGVLPLLRFLRDGGLIISCILVLGLAFLALRPKHPPTGET